MKQHKPATRLVVISDLHLGGVEPCMMSQPQQLAAFIASLSQRLAQDEQLELVIAGDFIDFLALPPCQSWTANPTEACTKLTAVQQGPCAPVFTALAEHIAAGHWLTVLIGNHDVELTLPSVRAALLRIIEAHPHQVTFIDDGSAYRIGGVLIEHGNRYDGANANDWEGLRYTRSALSRGEPPPRLLQVSAGSVIVEKIVNILKPRYPFIDLLQPQDKLLAYLLFAFEPSLLRRNIGKLGHLLKGAIRQNDNPSGLQPGRTREVASQPEEMPDPRLEAELQAVFGSVYQQLEQPSGTVGASDWLPIVSQIFQDSLAELIKQQKPIPRERLCQIRVTLRRWASDTVFQLDGEAGPYGKAAQRMIRNGAAETVIMGHTHLARHHGPHDKATYINTGTWADLITVPQEALLETDEGLDQLERFLRSLLKDEDVRQFRASYADVRIAADGRVERARLEFAS